MLNEMKLFLKEKYNIDFDSIPPKMQQIFTDVYLKSYNEGIDIGIRHGKLEGYKIGWNEVLEK